MASSNIGIRILKCECAVWPHYNSSATIPLARATLLSEQLIETGAFMKNNFLASSLSIIAFKIISCSNVCSGFNISSAYFLF